MAVKFAVSFFRYIYINKMQKSFASIVLLLIAFLASVTQITAAFVEAQDDNAEVKKADFPVYDTYRSMYDQYYNRWAAHAMKM